MPGKPTAIRDLVERWRADGEPPKFAEEPTDEEVKETHLEQRVRIAKGRGVPSRVADVLGDAIEQTAAVRAVGAFLKNYGRSTLILAGPNGTGKSVAAACAIYWRATDAADTAPLFVSSETLVECITGRSKARQELADRVRSTVLLVIDDLGDEYLDRHGLNVAKLTHLLTQRDGDRLDTIATTNLGWDGANYVPASAREQFAARYGGRVTSRLAGAGAWVDCDGEDLRTRPTQGNTNE